MERVEVRIERPGGGTWAPFVGPLRVASVTLTVPIDPALLESDDGWLRDLADEAARFAAGAHAEADRRAAPAALARLTESLRATARRFRSGGWRP